MPPGIRESNERPGLKPARLQILQNGTTKKIVDAISHCSIANSPMIPPHAAGAQLRHPVQSLWSPFVLRVSRILSLRTPFFRDNGTSQFR